MYEGLDIVASDADCDLVGSGAGLVRVVVVGYNFAEQGPKLFVAYAKVIVMQTPKVLYARQTSRSTVGSITAPAKTLTTSQEIKLREYASS